MEEHGRATAGDARITAFKIQSWASLRQALVSGPGVRP
jgi:hypothetical protein